MSDETTETTPETGRGLRVKYEEALVRISDLESERDAATGNLEITTMDMAFQAAGIDRDSGMGKAIAVIYDGPADPEVLREFAEAEFGFLGTSDPMAAKIANSHARLEQVSSTAGSIVPPTEADRLSAAEARGDTDTSMAIKSDQLTRLLRP